MNHELDKVGAGPILIVCYTFPPNPGIGGRRWAKFAKALAERGHDVHVIHSQGIATSARSMWTSDVTHPSIHVHPLPRRYPAVLARKAISGLQDRIAFHFWTRVLPLLVKGNIYDPTPFWGGMLIRTMRSLIMLHDIKHVIVSGAPFGLLGHATALKASHPQVQLVGDIRDTWTWGVLYGYNALSPKRLLVEQGIEARVMECFDRIISPSSPILDHLKTTYPHCGGKFKLVPHAIDPDELPRPTRPMEREGLRMAYAGSLYGSVQAMEYFNAVVAGFVAARSQHAQAFSRSSFDLWVTDLDTSPFERLVRDAGLTDTIRFHPPIEPRAVYAELQKADVLPVFIPEENRNFMGTKFAEMFFLRRPILHAGEPGMVSSHIHANGLGVSIRIHELAQRIPGLIAGTERIALNWDYDLAPQLLEQITTDLVEQVLLSGTRQGS